MIWGLGLQFYRDLRNLATPSTSVDFILTHWENPLPVHVQYVLAFVNDRKAET